MPAVSMGLSMPNGAPCSIHSGTYLSGSFPFFDPGLDDLGLEWRFVYPLVGDPDRRRSLSPYNLLEACLPFHNQPVVKAALLRAVLLADLWSFFELPFKQFPCGSYLEPYGEHVRSGQHDLVWVSEATNVFLHLDVGCLGGDLLDGPILPFTSFPQAGHSVGFKVYLRPCWSARPLPVSLHAPWWRRSGRGRSWSLLLPANPLAVACMGLIAASAGGWPSSWRAPFPRWFGRFWNRLDCVSVHNSRLAPLYELTESGHPRRQKLLLPHENQLGHR